MPVLTLLQDLYNITRALADRQDSDSLLRTIVESAARLTDATHGKISLPVEGGLVTQAITPNQPDVVGLFTRWEDAQLAWQAFSSREYVIINDYANYPHRRPIYDYLKLRAIIEIPLIANDTCLGILALARIRPEYPFDQEDIFKGQLLAQLAALVLDQRNLYDIAIRRLDEHEKTENALRESEARYRTLVDSLAEGIVMQGRDGAILACNKSAETILGLTIDQMMGRTSIDPRWRAIHEDSSPFPGENHPAMVTLNTGKPLTDVVMGVHKPSGELTWISINSRPMFRESEGMPYAVIASFIDITKRKEIERRTLQLEVERQRSLLLASFIQDASHEFRTPLSIIQTSLYLLNKSSDPQKRAQKSRSIEAQVRLIKQLVEMLVLQVRLESGQWSDIRIGLNLGDILTEVITSLNDDLSAHHHLLHFNTPKPEEIPVIVADKFMLETAFRFILENAIRYTPDGGNITIQLRQTSTHHEIDIQDNGVGIPEDVLPLIFHRFYRRDVAHTTPGFGLGLSIAKRIVEEHGGFITVHSEVGVGTTFTVGLRHTPNPA